MKLAVRLLVGFAMLVSIARPGFAQAELIEEVKRLAGEVADLRDANAAQSRRITQMQREIESLRENARESHDRATSKMGDFATREDLKKILDNIRDVDHKRESDRKLILDELERLGRTLSQPAERRPSSSRRGSTEREREPEETAPIEGTFLPYTVKDGQALSDIIKEYNGALKDQGRPPVTIEQVRQANPRIKNINNIFVGQKIQLPVPDKKK